MPSRYDSIPDDRAVIEWRDYRVAIMGNHTHVVVRTRPDVVKSWSDDDVALRCWRRFPQRRNEDGTPADPTEFKLNAIRNDANGLREKPRRLKNSSWFLRCLAEPIALQLPACHITVSNPGRAVVNHG